MKKVMILFVLFSLVFILLLPRDTSAKVHVKINNTTITVSICATIVIGGIVVMLRYNQSFYSENKKATDKKMSLSFKEQYLNEIRSISRPDGKITLLRW